MKTRNEGPADAYGVELNVGHGTWKDPMLELGTWEFVSHHT
jgi:hypothetical protein